MRAFPTGYRCCASVRSGRIIAVAAPRYSEQRAPRSTHGKAPSAPARTASPAFSPVIPPITRGGSATCAVRTSVSCSTPGETGILGCRGEYRAEQVVSPAGLSGAGLLQIGCVEMPMSLFAPRSFLASRRGKSSCPRCTPSASGCEGDVGVVVDDKYRAGLFLELRRGGATFRR